MLNEENALADNVFRLLDFCTNNMSKYNWHIIIADNGSNDNTYNIAKKIEFNIDQVSLMTLSKRGRGRALKQAWKKSAADVKVYMDIDLSTDLKFLPIICDAVAIDNYDIVIGSRLIKGSRIKGRTFKREIISRGYSILFRSLFMSSFKDAQCGFKAISSKASEDLLFLIEDNGWFFDTELLIVADKAKYTIKEIPVYWSDDPNSSVKIISTAWKDIKGLARLRFGGLSKARKQLKLNEL